MARSHILKVCERMSFFLGKRGGVPTATQQINCDLTPIESDQAQAAQDGQKLGRVEENCGFVNFAKAGDGRADELFNFVLDHNWEITLVLAVHKGF